jgi:hypothetical protein
MSIFVRSSKESSLVVSSVIRVEIATAISRLRKGGLLLPDEASAALSFLKAAIDHMDEEPVTSILLQTAATLGSPYALPIKNFWKLLRKKASPPGTRVTDKASKDHQMKTITISYARTHLSRIAER